MDASTQTPSDIPTALAALSAAGVTAAPPLEAAVTDAQWLVYASSGVTRTGTLGPLGAAIPQQTFGLDQEWFNVVPLGGGRVAFQRGDLLTVGEVRPDGSCVDVRDNHQVPINHSLVAVGADMVISYLVQTGPHGYVGRAIIGRIRPDGAYVQLSESHLWDFWTHIVPVQDGLVLFYNAETRLAATGRVTPDGGFADLQNHPGFDPWTHVLPAADGTLFFFHKPSGAAATGRVEADGGFTNLRSGTPFLGGWGFTPTRDGRMLIAPPQGGQLVARFPVDGWLADARPVAGQIPAGAVFVR